MTVYQICYEEYYLDGKCDVERCECYKNERDAAFLCIKYNKDNKDSDIKWYYEPVDAYEELEEANYDNLTVKWKVTFVNGRIDSIDRIGFVVDVMNDWELEEDSNDVNDRCVILSIRVEESDEDNIFKIAKKMYAAFMESDK